MQEKPRLTWMLVYVSRFSLLVIFDPREMTNEPFRGPLAVFFHSLRIEVYSFSGP